MNLIISLTVPENVNLRSFIITFFYSPHPSHKSKFSERMKLLSVLSVPFNSFQHLTQNSAIKSTPNQTPTIVGILVIVILYTNIVKEKYKRL